MTTDTEVDSDTASMWLHLLATGAVLSAPQLAEFAGVSRRTADTRLWTLTQRGFVLAKTIPGRKNGRGYSVDPTCRIPRGITLAHDPEGIRYRRARPDRDRHPVLRIAS